MYSAETVAHHLARKGHIGFQNNKKSRPLLNIIFKQKIVIQELIGLSSKPSGNYNVGPNFCFLS